MDDSSALYSQGTATDADCLHKATLQFRGDSSSQAIFTTNRTSSNCFAIQHFSGKVEYSVDDFMEKNLDQISPDFIVLLRNSDKFIVDLFSTDSAGAISVERHPKFEKTIVKAQLQTRPKRQPSRHGGLSGSYLASRRSQIGSKSAETPQQQQQQSALNAAIQVYQLEEDSLTVSPVLSQVFVTLTLQELIRFVCAPMTPNRAPLSIPKNFVPKSMRSFCQRYPTAREQSKRFRTCLANSSHVTSAPSFSRVFTWIKSPRQRRANV